MTEALVRHDLSSSVVQQLSDAIVVTDPLARVVLWNTGAERLFGWTEADALGRSITELGLAADDTPDVLAMTQRAFAGGSWEGTIPVLVKSGAMVLARIRSSPLWRSDQTVGGIIIQAHDTLYTPDSQLRMAARIAVLSSAGSRLGASLDVEATLDAIAELLVPGLADHCIVDLYDDNNVLRRQQVVNVPGFDDADAWIEIGGEVSYPSSHPCGQALSNNQPVLIDSESVDIDVFAGTPKIAKIYRRLGVRSIIAVPLAGQDNPEKPHETRMHGVISLLTSVSKREYDADDIDLAETLARRAGLALDNARLFTRQRNLAITLQQQLLPGDLPEVDGLQLAVRYRPAMGSDVGGDFYDAMELPGGRVGLIVGDVQGRGPHAAAIMGQLRAVIRAYGVLDFEPSRLLSHLDELVPELDDGSLVTCVYGIFDPFTRECLLATAGHLRPLQLGPDGCHELQLPENTPLGVGGRAFASIRFNLQPGHSLVLYTDGVIERRNLDLDSAVTQVRAALAHRYTASPGDIADTAIKAVPGPAEDDQALLVIKSEPKALAYRRIRLPALPEAVGDARRATKETFAAWGLEAQSELAELLVSELVTNAVRHAVPRPEPVFAVLWPDFAPNGNLDGGMPLDERDMELTLRRGSRSLWIEVQDSDPRMPRPTRPGETDEGGRGLLLIDKLSARWGTRAAADGKVVWVELSPDDVR